MKRLTVFAIFIVACNSPTNTINLITAKDTTIVFQSSVKHPTQLELIVKGYCSDTIMVNHNLIKGNIDTAFKQDWYSNTIAIDFKSLKADNCKLSITYTVR